LVENFWDFFCQNFFGNFFPFLFSCQISKKENFIFKRFLRKEEESFGKFKSRFRQKIYTSFLCNKKFESLEKLSEKKVFLKIFYFLDCFLLKQLISKKVNSMASSVLPQFFSSPEKNLISVKSLLSSYLLQLKNIWKKQIKNTRRNSKSQILTLKFQ